MASPRVQFRADPALLAQIDLRADDGAQMGTVRRDAERYYYLLAATRREIVQSGVFTPDELAAIADVCNGTLFEPHTAPFLWASVEDALSMSNPLEGGLAEKWAIDGPALVQKLRGLSYADSLVIVDAVERYWLRVSRGEDPEPAELLD